MTLYCLQCGRGAVVDRTGEVPPCRVCGPTTWRSADQPSAAHPYVLTMQDKRFLARLHIQTIED